MKTVSEMQQKNFQCIEKKNEIKNCFIIKKQDSINVELHSKTTNQMTLLCNTTPTTLHNTERTCIQMRGRQKKKKDHAGDGRRNCINLEDTLSETNC